MESIHGLVNSLNTSEFEQVRNSCILQEKNNPQVQKTIKLLDYLRGTEEIPTKEDCTRFIYGTSREDSFRQLKSRLQQRILDIIIQEANLDKIDMLEELDIQMIKLRKRFAQVMYLYLTKGNLPMVYSLLNSVIKSAEEYSIYSVLIEALKLKKQFVSLRDTEGAVEALEARMSFYQKCDEARNKAVDFYFRLVRKVDFEGGDNRETIQSLLLDGINELKQLYDELQTPVVGYYLKILEMAYFTNAKNYLVARDSCFEQLEFVQAKELYRKARVGMVYDNIGQLEIFNGNYDKAIDYFLEAQKHYKANSINVVVSKEQQFFAEFYAGKQTDAAKTIEFLINKNSDDQGSFRASKFLYYKSALLFSIGEFAECKKIILQNLDLAHDKAGWEVACRILSIMCNIELENLDHASLQIISFKKHLSRTSKTLNINNRDRIIFKILSSLEKAGFRFDEIWEKEEAQITELADSHNESSSWKILSPELIPFHSWLLGKKKSATKMKEKKTVAIKVDPGLLN